MDTLKALEGVAFTQYALSPIIQYVEGQKLAKFENAVNLSKIIFWALKESFMHICNMPVTNMPSIELIHWNLH